MNVLYEDNHVIAVVKPAGVLVQGDASGERTLMDAVKDYLAKKYNKPGAVYLGLVHRIDRRVTGVVVFARTSKAAARLSEQIRERTVDKTYRAFVEGQLQGTRSLTHFMSDNDGYVTVHDKPGAGRKECTLGFTVIKTEPTRSLLEIELETGRKHQIRAQLAFIGHPILGDERYGAKSKWPPPGIALLCHRMRFKHPTKDETISVEAPLAAFAG